MDNYNSNNDIYSSGDSWDFSRFAASSDSSSRKEESSASRRSTSSRSSTSSSRSSGSRRVSNGTKKPKRWALGLLFYYIFTLFFMELVFRVAVASDYTSFFSADLLYVFFFSVLGGAFCYVIGTFFKKKVNFWTAVVLTVLIGFFFAVQVVYYGMFKTPFIFDLLSEAGSAAEFAGNMIDPILHYFFPLLLIFGVPLAVLFLVGKKKFVFLRTNIRFKGLMAGGGLLLYLVLAITMLVGSKEGASPYNLYFKTAVSNETVATFGVTQSSTVDLFRKVFGISVGEGVSQDDLEGSYPGEEDLPVNTDPQIDTSPNVMDIDFETLIANEENKTIKGMHEYFNSVEPTRKNAHTGMFEGYNLIYFTAEAFSPYCVDQELTPTLYKLVHNGWEFTNYYSPLLGISTTDGEWGNCTGLFPTGYINGSLAFKYTGQKSTYLPFCLGNQFNKINYSHVWAYHNHTSTYYSRNLSHPNMGYNYQGYGKGDKGGLNINYSWPESDLEMMQATLPAALQQDSFHLYYMTVSGHMNYSFSGNRMSTKHKAEIQAARPNMSEQAQAYIACNMELDKALEYTIEQLTLAGKLDNTVIVLSTDHYPYGLDKATVEEFTGQEFDAEFEQFGQYKNNLIIYNNLLEHEVIDRPIYHLDLIPTISNLFGLEYDSRLLAGRDIFSDCTPLVVFPYGWMTDKVRYNSKNGTYVNLTDEAVDEEYVSYYKKLAANRKKYSKLIIQNDYYRKVFGEDGV
ncbi:MAG: sulfatase-like hydrolase/transferase [Clostridia bacterium]|nr:sulfatase-like hydrolase/transferase [Clostridia bacterium]